MEKYTSLCQILKDVCYDLVPFISRCCYLTKFDQSGAVKIKEDKSYVTIADIIIQSIFHFLLRSKIQYFIGEEETKFDVENGPFIINNQELDKDLLYFLRNFCHKLKSIRDRIDSEFYLDCGLIIDPIDGTREFCTGLEDQSAISLGLIKNSQVTVFTRL